MSMYSKLLYPYQFVRYIKPGLVRIGMTDIIKERISFDYMVNNNFKYNVKAKKKTICSDEVTCMIYNLDLDMYYIFYTPYQGKLINVNYKMLNNINSISNNQEKDNWIFDIEMSSNYKYSTYN